MKTTKEQVIERNKEIIAKYPFLAWRGDPLFSGYDPNGEKNNGKKRKFYQKNRRVNAPISFVVYRYSIKSHIRPILGP